MVRETPTLALTSFFFQAEDGIRDAQESLGLGDVYKRQVTLLLLLLQPLLLGAGFWLLASGC